MGAADQLIADAMIVQAVDLIRLEGSYDRATIRLLKEMEAELIKRLQKRELTSISRQRLLDLLAETKSVIAQTYVQIRKNVDLPALAEVQAAAVGGAVQAAVGARLTVGIPSTTTLGAMLSDLLIQGAPSKDWWDRQAGDTQFRFSNLVRQGIALGDTNAQIVAKLRNGDGPNPPIIETSRRNAEALVRTSIQTVANATRKEVFDANPEVIQGYRQLSTLDGRTTDICIAYSGAEWDLQGNGINGTTLPFNGGPPRHWNCRSVLVPIVRDLPGLPAFRGSTRASMDGPVRADITFSEWLKDKPKAFQDDLLGVGKADLWRDGKITLQQLLNQKGRPLTLDELRSKYAV